MMDKLIFVKPAPKVTAASSSIIRVSGDAYNTIAQIEAETGLSMSYIASQMIKFAAERMEIREGENNG